MDDGATKAATELCFLLNPSSSSMVLGSLNKPTYTGIRCDPLPGMAPQPMLNGGAFCLPQRDFPAPRLARRTSIRINTSLKLRARNGKELFGSKIRNMENQTRPGQEASRSRCFKFRTPRGSVKLSLVSGRERHERCDLECESQVFNVLKSPDTWYCAV